MRRSLALLALAALLAGSLSACASGGTPGAAPAPGKPAAKPAARPAEQSGGQSTLRADFFAGKTLTLMVNYSAGGPTDVMARLVAQHLDRFIPGRPTIIVENKAGAGGLVGMNYMYNAARKDGLTVGVHTPNYLRQMLGAEGVQYDESQFLYLGALSESQVLFANQNLGARSMRDLARSTAEIVAGGLAPDSSKDMATRAALNLFGIKYKYVTGYPGSNDVRAAFQRGEVNLSEESLTGWVTGYAPIVQDGTAVPLAQRGTLRGGEIVRDTRFGDVPTFFEAAVEQFGEGVREKLEYRALVSLVAASAMSRELVYPPGTDPALVEVLRRAVGEMFADPEFLAAAEKLFGYQVEFMSGAEAQELGRKVIRDATQDPEALNYLKRLSTERD